MKTFTLTFTEQQLQVLNVALVEMPFRLAQPLITHINTEIQKSLSVSLDNMAIAQGPYRDESDFSSV